MVFQEVNLDVWIPQAVDDFIEGKLINVQSGVGVNLSMLYTLETADKVKNVWGSTVLDARMSMVKLGDTIRITYNGLGEKKGGKNAPKLFKVEVDKPDAPASEAAPVAGAPAKYEGSASAETSPQ